MTEKIDTITQTRAYAHGNVVIRNQGDEGKPSTIELSFSSDEPQELYDHWTGDWYYQILGHDEGEMDLSRASEGTMPLLSDHDNRVESILGVVEKAWIEDGKGRAIARFADNDIGRNAEKMVRDGTLRNVSLAFLPKKQVRVEEDSEGPDTYRITKSEVLEISLVAVPQDYGVGVGRKSGHLPPVKRETKPEQRAPQHEESQTMTTPTEDDNKDVEQRSAPLAPEVVVTRAVEGPDHSSVAADIMAQAEQHRDIGGLDIASDVIRRKGTVQDFKDAVSAEYQKRFEESAKTTVVEDVYKGEHKEMRALDYRIGMSDEEAANFSFLRAGHALSTGQNCMELEAMREANKRITSQSLRQVNSPNTIPHEVLNRAVTAGTANSAAELIATDHLAGSFIDLLYNQSAILPHATTINGVVGNVDIPKITSRATVDFKAEGAAQNAANVTFGQVSLSPKRVAGSVEYTQQAAIQSTPDVEQIIRNVLAETMMEHIDSRLLFGVSSANEPTGVLSGITNAATGLMNTATGANAVEDLTWADIVALETRVAEGNADKGDLRYIVPPFVRGKLKSTEQATNTARFIWDMQAGDTPVNGYPVTVTNQIPKTLAKGTYLTATAILFGDLSSVLFALWSGVDLLDNPYAKDQEGIIRLTASAYVDMAVRYQESFAAFKDVKTV